MSDSSFPFLFRQMCLPAKEGGKLMAGSIFGVQSFTSVYLKATHVEYSAQGGNLNSLNLVL